LFPGEGPLKLLYWERKYRNCGAILAIKKVAAYGRFGSLSRAKAAEKKIKSSKIVTRYPLIFPFLPIIVKKGTSDFLYKHLIIS